MILIEFIYFFTYFLSLPEHHNFINENWKDDEYYEWKLNKFGKKHVIKLIPKETGFKIEFYVNNKQIENDICCGNNDLIRVIDQTISYLRHNHINFDAQIIYEKLFKIPIIYS